MLFSLWPLLLGKSLRTWLLCIVNIHLLLHALEKVPRGICMSSDELTALRYGLKVTRAGTFSAHEYLPQS